MKSSEMLRSLASELRTEATKRAEARRAKAANVLIAATGLGLLRAKLGGTRG